MARIYTTKQGDMLDWICWRYYSYLHRIKNLAVGDYAHISHHDLMDQDPNFPLSSEGKQFQEGFLRGAVEAVLEANPGLVDQGLILPAGIQIALPDFDPTVIKNAPRLWD